MSGIELAISSFRGENHFLSNFYESVIEYKGKIYATSEHAYQAVKCTNDIDHEKIRFARSAGETKRLSRTLPRRQDWDQVKLVFMEEILRCKFSNPLLMLKLKNTRPKILIEGNHWGDRFWGVCSAEGENNLGKLLMKIRDEK